MTWNDAVIAITIAIAGGVAGVMTAVFGGFKEYVSAWWRSKQKDLKRKEYAYGLRLLGEYKYTIDIGLAQLEYVDRLVIFCGQNGGGIPKPGQPYTIRGIYAWSKKGEDLYTKYNFDLKIDSDYYHMISELVEKGSLINVTADMKDTSALKSFYVEESVVSSALYLLNISEEDNALFYASVASYRQTFTREQLIRIEMAIQRLRSLHNQDVHP